MLFVVCTCGVWCVLCVVCVVCGCVCYVCCVCCVCCVVVWCVCLCASVCGTACIVHVQMQELLCKQGSGRLQERSCKFRNGHVEGTQPRRETPDDQQCHVDVVHSILTHERLLIHKGSTRGQLFDALGLTSVSNRCTWSKKLRLLLTRTRHPHQHPTHTPAHHHHHPTPPHLLRRPFSSHMCSPPCLQLPPFPTTCVPDHVQFDPVTTLWQSLLDASTWLSHVTWKARHVDLRVTLARCVHDLLHAGKRVECRPRHATIGTDLPRTVVDVGAIVQEKQQDRIRVRVIADHVAQQRNARVCLASGGREKREAFWRKEPQSATANPPQKVPEDTRPKTQHRSTRK